MANTGDHGCQPLSIPRSAGGHIGSCQSHDANLHTVQISPKEKPGHSHIISNLFKFIQLWLLNVVDLVHFFNVN